MSVDGQVLEFAGAFVGSQAEDENPPVGVIQEGLNGITPLVGIDGHRVESEVLEQRLRVHARAVPHVAPLAVADRHDAIRDERERAL